MSKSVAKTFKGIEFVQISELPSDQAAELKNWAVGRDVIIKILVNNKIHEDCMLFNRYSEWYEVYRKSNKKPSSINQEERVISGKSLVLKAD